MPFTIGEVRAEGTNPCPRCAVPARESLSGHPVTGFQKRFSELRHAHVPPWARASSRITHFYTLGVNTRVAPTEYGKRLRVGDPVRCLDFRLDDLSGEPTRRLIERHLAGMRANSPAESVHALDVDALREPNVTFWSAWAGSEIAGCGALKQLDPQRGEIKSMRVADSYLGHGIGRAMLEHIVSEARARGMESLWLETGSGEPFVPAIRLYESAGFIRCDAFDGYVNDSFAVFMTRNIKGEC